MRCIDNNISPYSYTFFYLLTNKNNIYVIGSNEYGQLGLLGLSEKQRCYEFTKIDKFLEDIEIKDIQLSKTVTLLLDVLGNVYFTGIFSTEMRSKTFTKLDLSFKVKKISTAQNNMLLLNEFNELYLLKQFNGINIVPEFIKINLDYVTGLYYSFGDYYIIKNKFNEYFGIGNNSEGQLGFDSCYEVVTEPKKLDYFTTNRKYVNMLSLVNHLYILSSDYKINCNEPINEEEEYTELQTNLFEKFMNGKLNDIYIL
ncbi:hypothetical protein ABK040_003859 [Willaertia magna]